MNEDEETIEDKVIYLTRRVDELEEMFNALTNVMYKQARELKDELDSIGA